LLGNDLKKGEDKFKRDQMARKIKDPGFGYKDIQNAKSIINKDGSSNVIHLNKRRSLDDLYSYFIEISWNKFFLLIVFVYTFINILFGLLYTLIGIEEITKTTGSFFSDFLNGFFFSAQTLTTVGYGGIAPHGVTSNSIAAFEAMIGLLSFSFITGLLYGRFSKPKATIRFSENIILREFKGKRAIMFRLMNSRKTIMIEPTIKVTLSITDEETEEKKFYNLSLERDSIMYLPTVWTIVHEIDEKSPLYELSNEKISKLNAELFLLLEYHEESFAQNVYQIYSYDFTEMEVDVKYKSSYNFDKNGFTILDHDTLSEVEKM
jgi:inward rectifier potassium channel